MMRYRLSVAARAFALGFLAWVLLSVTVVTPGWADDDDEDDEGTPTTTTTSTTSTTTSTTTTTLPTTTTTTTPTTTTTHPTTTTTHPTTTTTAVASVAAPPPPPDLSELTPPVDTPEPTTPLQPSGDTEADSTFVLTDKGSFVISLVGKDADRVEPGQAGVGRRHIDPLQGMELAFNSAVETLKGQFLQAVILGLVVATLAVIGLDRRREDQHLSASAA